MPVFLLDSSGEKPDFLFFFLIFIASKNSFVFKNFSWVTIFLGSGIQQNPTLFEVMLLVSNVLGYQRLWSN